MVLKINMFSSHCDSTYPDVLFMRWRRVDGKEKHRNVNRYISIQRKPWNKTRALFQMCKSSAMRKIWCLTVFHHDTHTHCVQHHDRAEGSSNSWPVSLALENESLKTCMTTFSPASSISRKEIRHLVTEHSLPHGIPGLLYKQKQITYYMALRVTYSRNSLLVGLKKKYSRLLERWQWEESTGLNIRIFVSSSHAWFSQKY